MLLEHYEILIIGMNIIMIVFTYLWMYPRISTVDVKKISRIDFIVLMTSLTIAGLFFWDSNIGFSLIYFSVNWFWFTLITGMLIELPFFIWFIRKYDLWKSYLQAIAVGKKEDSDVKQEVRNLNTEEKENLTHWLDIGLGILEHYDTEPIATVFELLDASYGAWLNSDDDSYTEDDIILGLGAILGNQLEVDYEANWKIIIDEDGRDYSIIIENRHQIFPMGFVAKRVYGDGDESGFFSGLNEIIKSDLNAKPRAKEHYDLKREPLSSFHQLDSRSEAINTELFWKIVNEIHNDSKGDMDVKCELLEERLFALDSEDLVAFFYTFDEYNRLSFTWEIWDVVYKLNGGCSDDCFTDFRSTLISMGEEVFTQALHNPNSLFDVGFFDNDYAYEGYAYTIYNVVEEVLGELPDALIPFPNEPSGQAWDEEAVWPNNRQWQALHEGPVYVEDEEYLLSTIDCGELNVPSGKLICCDPFATMEQDGNPYIAIAKGQYKVVVTLADVSEEQDGTHIREAYASLIIAEDKEEVSRQCLQATVDGMQTDEILEANEYFGFNVDAGVACFVDALSLKEGMPEDSHWYDEVFDSDKDSAWFTLMDNPEHIREGIANTFLPLTEEKNNIILFHSGWGDGFYPIVGGYDSAGDLIAIHIDFFVVSEPEAEEAVYTPDGKICPNCKEDIGIMAIVNAGLPTTVKCSHCNAAVIYKPFPWLYTVAWALALVIVYSTVKPYMEYFSDTLAIPLFVSKVIFTIVLGLVFEVSIALYLRENAILYLKNSFKKKK